MTYRMTNSYDCGPCALAEASGKSVAEVKMAMRWPDNNDSRDNLMDSPANHFLAKQRLRIPYRVVTAGQIMRSECKPDRTVILIHGDGAIGSWLAQHWVVLYKVEADRVHVQWGDGNIHHWAFDKFQERYSNGGPTATAYEVMPVVAKPVTKYSWWARLMERIFGR
jgi:ABC-type bacteriocin/lantibiotic exporter with double-glycine peptidase domain